MNRIYRIEHKVTKEGIYRNFTGWTPYNSINWKDDYRRHPSPNDDSTVLNNIPKGNMIPCGKGAYIDQNFLKDFVFGFSSLKQLKAWFYSDILLYDAHSHDFHLAVYSGLIYKGNTQAMIHKESKVLIRTILLTKIINLDNIMTVVKDL